jgi:hypothetical protein
VRRAVIHEARIGGIVTDVNDAVAPLSRAGARVGALLLFIGAVLVIASSFLPCVHVPFVHDSSEVRDPSGWQLFEEHGFTSIEVGDSRGFALTGPITVVTGGLTLLGAVAAAIGTGQLIPYDRRYSMLVIVGLVLGVTGALGTFGVLTVTAGTLGGDYTLRYGIALGFVGACISVVGAATVGWFAREPMWF